MRGDPVTHLKDPFVHRFARPPLRMAGLSLVELMVAVALGLLILTGLVTVFVNASAARNEIERTSRQIENGRYAIEILSDDLRLAGFYGELNPATALTNLTPVPQPTSMNPADDPASDPCSTTVADWERALYLHVQGYAASNGGLSCLSATTYKYKAGTDVLVVRRARACNSAECPSPTDPSLPDGPYLQVALCGDEANETSHRLGLKGATFDRTQKDCATPAVLRRYFVNIYFVSTTNGVNGTGDSIPTLKRLEFTGDATTPFTEIPLVEGIEHFHVEYGLDNDGDGAADAYVTDPGTVAGWMNVVTARFFVLARNIDASPGFTDTKTYELGSVAIAAAGDRYRRHVYSSLVRIANPAGRRELP